MYLPRHYSKQKKRNFFQVRFLLIIILLTIAVFTFLYRKDISRLFYSNRLAKISKLDEEITQKNLSNQVNIQIFNKYTNMTLSFVESNPTNPTAYYLMAKSFYYKAIYEGMKFDVTNLVMFLSNNSIKIFQDNPKLADYLENMYQNAMKARAFNPDFEYGFTNDFMIYLYQVLKNQRDASYIDKEIIKIKYINLGPDFVSLYIWVGILNSARAGNFDSLEKFLQINEKVKPEFKLTLNSREVSFLKGYITFYLNDYITALNYFRESKANMDLITIEAIKKEAEIFYMQNLPKKSVKVLESLYMETGETDKQILLKIHFIQQNRPGVSTVLQKEIDNLEILEE